MFDRLI